MKRTSSLTTSNSEMSLTPRARNSSTSSWTRFSGALAPEEMPTTRRPSSHSSCTSPALSIRCASVPQSRATSTSRFEFDELRRADHEHQVAFGGHLLDGRLAVGRGVADVVGARTDDLREALAQAREDRRRFVDGERGLGDVGDPLGILDLELLDVLLVLHEHDLARAPRPSCLRPPRGRRGRRARSCSRPAAKRDGLAVDLRDQRAGRVDRLQARCSAPSRTLGATPCAENTQTAPSGTSVSSSTKIAPRSRELLDDVLVVHDLLAHVDGRAVDLAAPVRPSARPGRRPRSSRAAPRGSASRPCWPRPSLYCRPPSGGRRQVR